MKSPFAVLAPVVKTIPGARIAARIMNLHISPIRGTYARYRQEFIENGQDSAYGQNIRAEIVRRFEAVDRHVKSATTPTDGLVLAEGLLSMDSPGEIVECGCYFGASSAKLSIIASILGRKLIIFDSFAGLPAGGEQVIHARRKVKEGKSWQAGQLAAGLDVVRGNIQSYGEVSVCSFVPGWFQDTLVPRNLPDRVGAAFTDVDLERSARECLLALWPRLSQYGIYFTHDTAYLPALQAICDDELWVDQLQCARPIMFGAGFGVCDLSPHLGYMVKGSNVSATYLKSLMLTK